MRTFIASLAVMSVVAAAPSLAQDSSATASDDATTETVEASDAGLLTQAELETLVAPVALYPDTLLIQIFVAATQPLEVVKADRFLLENAETDAEALKPEIEAQGWDPSVEVLAVGFPDVIADMAQHIEWTETMGDAMNAQADDVMDAVQTMRDQAINSGALISGEEQTVEVDSDDNVIIQPTDPEVVYVPQYETTEVYDSSSSDLVAAAAITFGTFLLIDAIFDDDDDWYGYWGCRNCGWGGGGIYPRPDVDIDIDGNVNIGNDITIGDGSRPDGGWRPDAGDQDAARDRIAEKRDPGGETRLPIDKSATNSDALRSKLSERSGAEDISRPSNRAGDVGSRELPQVNRPSTRPAGTKQDAIARTGGDLPQVNRPNATAPEASRPSSVQRPAEAQRPTASTRPAAASRDTSALRQNSSGQRTAAASRRGGGHGGGHRGQRRR